MMESLESSHDEAETQGLSPDHEAETQGLSGELPGAPEPAPDTVAAMQAIANPRYGSPAEALEVRDVGRPTPGPGQVLVRVRAVSVNPVDWHYLTGRPYVMRALGAGLRRPARTIPGHDLAGVVDSVGSGVTRFAPGDEVFGDVDGGAFAEYACAPEEVLAAKPAAASFEEAAAVPVAGLTALQGLRDHARVKPGDRVLINGASGGVGTFAVQIAKAMGAEVTGVCSARNVDLVRSIGADHVVNYTRDDFTADDRRYDVLFDLVGNRKLSDCRRVMAPKATFVICGGPKTGTWFGPLAHMAKLMLSSIFVSQRIVTFVARARSEDLAALAAYIDAGQVRPVIDRNCTLAEVPDALAYLERGRARGKIVATVR